MCVFFLATLPGSFMKPVRTSDVPHAPVIVTLAMFLFYVVAPVAVEAQVESGKIVGTVRDSSGAVVTGADVATIETQTNVSRKTRTDNSGEYVFTELKPGIYSVTVEHAGYKKAEQTSFKLDVNQV